MALADSRERSEGEVSEVVCWTTFGQWTTFLGGLKGARKYFPPVFHYLGLSIYFFIPFKKKVVQVVHAAEIARLEGV